MEQPHLSTQLDHLERKYQEAQATIARLQQRVESQEYVAQEQTQQIQQLEAELAQAKSQLVQTGQFEAQLTHLKEEMIEFIERRYPRSQPSLPETNVELVTKQLENQTKAINEIRREVDRAQRHDEQLALARAETTRLNKEISSFQAQLDKLSRDLEARTSPIALIEEQRRTDMSKLAELQTELPELHKKIEANVAKIKLVSQQVPQFAKYEAALDTIREEIREYREHMDFQLAQRERQIKDWTGLAEVTERRIREIEASMEKYTEFYQLNKRALTSLQDFQERLQRDQHRFGELQRLAEERQRAETEKFLAEFEQRWQKQSMELQPHFVDFQKSIEALQHRMDDFAKVQEALESQLNLALQIIEEDILARAQAAADWQRRFEEIAEGQV